MPRARQYRVRQRALLEAGMSPMTPSSKGSRTPTFFSDRPAYVGDDERRFGGQLSPPPSTTRSGGWCRAAAQWTHPYRVRGGWVEHRDARHAGAGLAKVQRELAGHRPREAALRRRRRMPEPRRSSPGSEGREVRMVETESPYESNVSSIARSIIGTPVAVDDARGLTVFSTLDLQSRVLRTDSVDAGSPLSAFDAPDRPAVHQGMRGHARKTCSTVRPYRRRRARESRRKSSATASILCLRARGMHAAPRAPPHSV
jgi:hypothetical protein